MALTVKAYLKNEVNDFEIRRFTLDQDVASNYAYLIGKITTVFPELAAVKIKLFYKGSSKIFHFYRLFKF